MKSKQSIQFNHLFFSAILAFLLLGLSFSGTAQYQMENLNRGVVALRNGGNNFVSWRWLGLEDDATTYNLYRDGVKVNSSPLTVCNYTDNGASATATYTVKAVVNGVEQTVSETAKTWASLYKTLPLNVPAGGTNASGSFTYSPNDCSVGDIDGDGEYEIFVKWDPSNSKDNSLKGYTGNVYIDCYKLNGTFLWRIDLGKNIRAGAHYTQFLVYDFDGDGKAEMACKTADGTKDGKGVIIGSSTADYRNSSGYVLSGPEFLTVFNGQTGAAMATVNYTPARGTVSSWGDSYGNRVDRFVATVAYLDGKKPSMVFGRGYYTRLVRAAWDWNGTSLTQRWIFDSNDSGNGAYKGQGNHQMTVADVDNDGKQEIINGASVIDDNGAGLFTTGHGHGDALHMSDMDPDRPGLEIWQPNEEPAKYGNYAMELKSASNGANIFTPISGNQGDVGRGMAADIDPNHKGYEMWVMHGTTYTVWNCKGQAIAGASRPSVNFAVYWDGDLQRELLDGSKIDKFVNGRASNLLTLSDAAWGTGTSCNTTKATPNLSADLFGDWREEVILHSADNKNLLIYTTTIPTTYKFRTLMHDPTYRVAISWQNTAYNQPPHLGYYLGGGMATPAKPNIKIVGAVKDCNGVLSGGAYLDECGKCVAGNTGKIACVKDCNGVENGAAKLDDCGICYGGNTGATACSGAIQGEEFCSAVGVAEIKNAGFVGEGYLNLDNAQNTAATWYIVSNSNQSTQLGIRYANGSTTARGMTLTVNGTQPKTILGNTTGAWTTWKMEYVTVNLLSGVNKIIITSNTVDGAPNIDLISFSSSTIKSGGCAADCQGVVGGLAVKDSCGVCTGGTTGRVSCTLDCNGMWGGTAFLDNCKVCIGGTTNNLPCSSVTISGESACTYDGILSENSNTGFVGEGYLNTTNAIDAYASWIVNSSVAQKATISFRYANGGSTSRDGVLKINGVVASDLILAPTGEWSEWEVSSVNVNLVKGANELSLAASTADGLANIDVLYFSAGVSDAKCLITAIESDLSTTFNLYPNPTNSLVQWNSERNWELLDALGVHLISGSGQAIDLALYPSGVYFVKFENETMKVVRK